MIAFFPFFVAALIVVIVFVRAMKNGIAAIVSGGISALISLITLFVTFDFLPRWAETHLDIGLTWKLALILSVISACLIYVLVRLMAGIVVNRLMNPDSWLHFLADGIPAGILSLFPSLVVVSFFFVCVRMMGTIRELDYVASVSQPGIEKAVMRFPNWPMTTRWRDSLEKAPCLADLFDVVEPLSRRQNRNLAALILMDHSHFVSSFLARQSDVATLLERPEIVALSQNKAVLRAIEAHDQPGLVLADPLRKTASDPAVKFNLQTLKIRKLVESFVDSLPKPRKREPKQTSI